MITAGVAKVSLCLVALFVGGGVCGFTVAARCMFDPVARTQLEERWIETRRREDARRLQLTPEQVEQVRPHYQQMLADIRAVREEARKQGRALWPQLTSAQQQEFLLLNEQRRAQWQKNGSR